ncbi:secretory phospholipase A2 receptor-like [Heteronotia binoei]|uniref:secretory phospholipase A2 receptor-like n=1 Tax=Heteronotia binoei TaxID=13085 RepID=UPI00292DBE23|nr:secretory phospholipase A2 receptor-like [Heteronotia binoei]
MSDGCLGIGPQGEQNLAVSSCSELKPWVCKTTVSSQSLCPTEPGWRAWNGSCYFWDSSLISGWHEALQVCQRFRKTELLYLTSLQEKEWVSSNFGGSFWTGLNDLKDESVFRWTTQESLSQPLAQYLHDDVADGGLKDCVWFDTVTGFLVDASCKEKRPFLCKGSEATDWFDKQSGRGTAGDLELLYPAMESLEQAKQECLLERTACVAVLQADEGFFLISSMEDIISKPDSTLYTWSICAKGFSGPRCHKALTPLPRPACDCSGRFQTTAKKGKEGERGRHQADRRQAGLWVCGIPVQSCVDDCRRMTNWENCSLCLPACTEACLSNLDPEELALITMIQFRVSHSLNLTAEDERDRGNSSKIIYDPRYP